MPNVSISNTEPPGASEVVICSCLFCGTPVTAIVLAEALDALARTVSAIAAKATVECFCCCLIASPQSGVAK
jgi:hypothetical protein